LRAGTEQLDLAIVSCVDFMYFLAEEGSLVYIGCYLTNLIFVLLCHQWLLKR
jgi:hypothetical protein